MSDTLQSPLCMILCRPTDSRRLGVGSAEAGRRPTQTTPRQIQLSIACCSRKPSLLLLALLSSSCILSFIYSIIDFFHPFVLELDWMISAMRIDPDPTRFDSSIRFIITSISDERILPITIVLISIPSSL